MVSTEENRETERRKDGEESDSKAQHVNRDTDKSVTATEWVKLKEKSENRTKKTRGNWAPKKAVIEVMRIWAKYLGSSHPQRDLSRSLIVAVFSLLSHSIELFSTRRSIIPLSSSLNGMAWHGVSAPSWEKRKVVGR